MAINIPESMAEAVVCQLPVRQPPHDFYRYPARFSPVFAREVISAFTKPRDVVLDPFCGGGTTLIEAITLGRRVIGSDISPLAAFLTRTKLTALSVHDRRAIMGWTQSIKRAVLPSSDGYRPVDDPYGRTKNLPSEAKLFLHWVLRKIAKLESPRQEAFVRMILLSVGQWALDCKDTTPNAEALRYELHSRIEVAVSEFAEYLEQVATTTERPAGKIGCFRRVFSEPAETLASNKRIPVDWRPVKLVLTSPPYPGVHVLYHRWQVHGRRETPAAFWLAGCRDGSGASYYTFGSRHNPALTKYFQRLTHTFTSLRALMDSETTVIQLVAFSDPSWQLDAYLEALAAAGFREEKATTAQRFLRNGRIWRDVPGRKWYANGRKHAAAGQEVLLIHRPI